jgi:hypothetical protein
LAAFDTFDFTRAARLRDEAGFEPVRALLAFDRAFPRVLFATMVIPLEYGTERSPQKQGVGETALTSGEPDFGYMPMSLSVANPF